MTLDMFSTYLVTRDTFLKFIIWEKSMTAVIVAIIERIKARGYNTVSKDDDTYSRNIDTVFRMITQGGVFCGI